MMASEHGAHAAGRPQPAAPSFQLVASLGCQPAGLALPPSAVAGAAASSGSTAGGTSASCFDCLACGGGTTWAALRTAPRTIQVLRGSAPHATLLLPEPVAAVQLGAAAAQQAAQQAAQPAAAVVVAVGESCRVWAWALCAEPAAGGSAAQPSSGSGVSSKDGERRGKRKLGLRAGSGTELDSPVAQTIPLALNRGSASGIPWLAAAAPVPQLQLLSEPLLLPAQQGGAGPAAAQQGRVFAAEAELAALPDVGGLQQAGGRAQLAAQVVWEFLDALWKTGQGMEGLAAPGGPAACPIPLASLAASSAAAPHVVHSVATWAASPHLPPDACCACYVASPPAAGEGLPGSRAGEFRGSTHVGWPSGSGSGSAAGAGAGEGGTEMDWEGPAGGPGSSPGHLPLGYLLVGTPSGNVAAYPVGAPLLGPSSTAGPAGPAAPRLVAVVHGSRLLPVWLPAGASPATAQVAAAAGEGRGPPARLLLHAASGTVARAPPDPCSCVLIAGGGGGADSSGGASSGSSREGHSLGRGQLGGGIVAAVLGVSGDVDSVAVQGNTLFYTTRGQLHALDCRSLAPLLRSPSSSSSGGGGGAAAADATARAARIPAPADIRLLAAPSGEALAAGGSCRLALLSFEGLLLSMLCPSSASLAGAGHEAQRGMGDLEHQIQGLLGDVAELSARQERHSRHLLSLDSQLASLAVAIPAVQSINCGCTAGLYCWVRPLYCLAEVLGGSQAGVAVEVSLANGGLWALPAGHSLVVAYSAGSQSANSSIDGQPLRLAHAAPLPALPPGATHTLTCFLAAPPPASHSLGGTLRVLLCHHSTAGTAGTAHAALLHSVRLDPLHFCAPGPSQPHRSALPPLLQQHPLLGSRQQQHQQQQQLRTQHQPEGQEGEVEARLRLQLPTWLFGRRPDAGAALAGLLGQGLSSLDLSPSPALPPGPSATGLAAAAASLRRSVLPKGSGAAGAGPAAGTVAGGAFCTQRVQQERAARQERRAQLLASQLGPGATLQAGAGSHPAEGSISEAGAAWWEPLLQKQREARALSPAAAFSLLAVAPGDAERSRHSMLSAAGAGPGRSPLPATVHADFPAGHSSFSITAAAGGLAPVELSAKLLPGKGTQGGASWQHADLEVSVRAGDAHAALEAHAALLRRVQAMQFSLPEQDPPSGLRLAGALLAPQGATSAAQSAVEGADETALEAALCMLRQLKARAVELRDEAKRAQRALADNRPSSTAEDRQRQGLQLRQDLVELAIALRQQVGCVPVILG